MFFINCIEYSLDYIKEMIILAWAYFFVLFIQDLIPIVRETKVYRVRRKLVTIGGYATLILVSCVSS